MIYYFILIGSDSHIINDPKDGGTTPFPTTAPFGTTANYK